MGSFAAAAFIGLCLLGDVATGYRHTVEQQGADTRAGGEDGAQRGSALVVEEARDSAAVGAEEARDSAAEGDGHGTAGCGQGAAEETLKQYMDLRSKNYATDIGKLLTDSATYKSQEGVHGPSRDAVVEHLVSSVVAPDTYRNIQFECVVVVNFEATGKVTYQYKRPGLGSWLSAFADMSTKFRLKCTNGKWLIQHILSMEEGAPTAGGCTETNAMRTAVMYNYYRDSNSVKEIGDLLAEKVTYTSPGSGRIGHQKMDVLEYLANSPVDPNVHRNRTVQCAIAVGEEATGKITYQYQKPRLQNWFGAFTTMSENIAMVCSGRMWLIDYVAVTE